MKPKILVIVGPTAAGKTSLSIELAKRFDGEIVSADSRQVYRGMDLGTGKVTKEEMDGVPHHLLDVADPMDVYTVSDYVRDGRKAIADILVRGRLPIVVGGTFFYVDALLGRVSAAPVPPNESLRNELEVKSNDELFAILEKADPERAETIDQHNKRRLIRALEIVDALGQVPSTNRDEPYDAYIIGIDIDKETLHANIAKRLQERVAAGMIKEVEHLHSEGVTQERMEEFGLEYRYVARFLKGELTKDEMLAELETKIRQFAKRQMTWLRRDKSIRWFKKDETQKTLECVESFLD